MKRILLFIAIGGVCVLAAWPILLKLLTERKILCSK